MKFFKNVKNILIFIKINCFYILCIFNKYFVYNLNIFIFVLLKIRINYFLRVKKLLKFMKFSFIYLNKKPFVYIYKNKNNIIVFDELSQFNKL